MPHVLEVWAVVIAEGNLKVIAWWALFDGQRVFPGARCCTPT